jgi:hypothetical protein
MKPSLTIGMTTHASLAKEDHEYWQKKTPEQRVAEVERLRLEAGKFLYEYPAPFRRVISVIRKTPC